MTSKSLQKQKKLNIITFITYLRSLQSLRCLGMDEVLKIRSPTRVRRSCLSSISNPLIKVETVTFNATNVNTTLLQSNFIDLPLESFLFLRGEYFAFF